MEVVENSEGPDVYLGPDIQGCEGASITISAGISGVHYLWQDGSTNPTYQTGQSGEIILQVSNNCGTDADTVLVDLSGMAPLFDLGNDTTLCDGSTLMLTAAVSPGSHLEWQDGSTSNDYLVTRPGLYHVAVSNICGMEEDTVLVDFIAVPQPFLLGPDTILCLDEQLVLTVPQPGFNVLWQDGSSQPIYTVDHPEWVSLQLSNACGSESDTLLVDYDPNTPSLNLQPLLEWCPGDVITLNATQPFAAEYLWSTGSTSPVLTINTPGVFTIEVTTPCSYVNQAVDIIAQSNCDTHVIQNDYYIPNVFSPNGDNINDVFAPSFGADIVVTGMTGSIFDRWGNQVFKSSSLNFSWDGRYHGEDLPAGVYAYVLYCDLMTDGHKQIITLSGDVTLLR